MNHEVKPMHLDEMTVTYPELRAGAMWRRTVRHAIRSARVLGAEVHVAERWRLLDSQFTIRAIGSEEDLKPLMKLAAIAIAQRGEADADQTA